MESVKVTVPAVSYPIYRGTEDSVPGHKESKGASVEKAMRRVSTYVETLPVSTADCERGFSRMNVICDELRIAQ